MAKDRTGDKGTIQEDLEDKTLFLHLPNSFIFETSVSYRLRARSNPVSVVSQGSQFHLLHWR
jgi:hypothetical protein